jgi:hypothetical protein
VDPVERKSQLISQGALHRAELVFARHAVMTKLRPQALAQGLLERLAGGTMGVFLRRKASGSAGMLQHLMPVFMLLAPLVLRAASKRLASERSKPIRRLMPALLAVAGAALVFGIRKRQQARRHSENG